MKRCRRASPTAMRFFPLALKVTAPAAVTCATCALCWYLDDGCALPLELHACPAGGGAGQRPILPPARGQLPEDLVMALWTFDALVLEGSAHWALLPQLALKRRAVQSYELVAVTGVHGCTAACGSVQTIALHWTGPERQLGHQGYMTCRPGNATCTVQAGAAWRVAAAARALQAHTCTWRGLSRAAARFQPAPWSASSTCT